MGARDPLIVQKQVRSYAGLTRRGQILRLRRLAGEALKRFAVEPAAVSLASHMHNTIFKVVGADGRLYALRIHRAIGDPTHPVPTRQNVEAEVWWLDRLRADLALAVPAPVRTPEGEAVISVGVHGVPEERLCVLFEWRNGRFIQHRLQPAHLEAVGRFAARLHNYSAQLAVPAGFDRLQVDAADGETAEAVIRYFADNWSAGSATVIGGVFRRVQQVQERLGRTPDVYGLIHGDLHQENFLFQDGQVGLIDFDDCGWGHYLHDLTVAIYEVSYLSPDPSLRAALLSGYRKGRDFPAEHEAMLETYLMLREIHITIWFLLRRDDPTFPNWARHVASGMKILERFVAESG